MSGSGSQTKLRWTKGLDSTCAQSLFKVHELDDQFRLELFKISEQTPKIVIIVKIDKVDPKLELDTGSAVPVMIVDNISIFKKPPIIEYTDVRLKTYTNKVIELLGAVQALVKKDHQSL
ncbi:hypothetical protein ElyMa_006105900 [Elysia marginata]|uniref:Uncharacterized protein n=1 Tax=Elysia marginata TaxID=1093978 RepID=A0AAV4GSB7_9GAST|nr:hypothetical protein ElyMa_006105900 [Elysia marginata]